MIYFAIPGLYENKTANQLFYSMRINHPECFYDDFDFDAFYGNFQFCIWDGGRIFSDYSHATIEEIQSVKQMYNESMKVPMRFIYTNTKIEPKHCYDRFCNIVTEICEDEMNEIVVNSPILEEYLRKTYPKYKYISSTTKCLRNKKDFLNELHNKNYLRICLDYNLNKEKDFLDTLSQEEKDKCEFLINAVCSVGCPNRKKHYDFNSIASLKYNKPYQLNFCNIPGDNLYPYEYTSKIQLTSKDIRTWYAPHGFSHFKIEGRTFPDASHLGNLVRYMVKPEYQLYIITNIYKALENI